MSNETKAPPNHQGNGVLVPGPELVKLQERIAKLEDALAVFAAELDESLLLDEKLADDWDKLRQLVVTARAALEGKDE